VNITALRHLGGEAAVGASAGVLGAWLLHRLQSTVVLLSVLGSVGTAAALHLKWVAPEQVRVVGMAAMRLVQQKFAWLARRADLDGDGELTLDDGVEAYTRVAPVVRKHTALTGGIVCGFLGAYSALR
jgi:hypothetical protein